MPVVELGYWSTFVRTNKENNESRDEQSNALDYVGEGMQNSSFHADGLSILI